MPVVPLQKEKFQSAKNEAEIGNTTFIYPLFVTLFTTIAVTWSCCRRSKNDLLQVGTAKTDF